MRRFGVENPKERTDFKSALEKCTTLESDLVAIPDVFTNR